MSNLLTTADAILKEDYQPLVRDQLNNANAYSAQLKRTNKGVAGREALLALHTAYNEGVGARRESDVLPTAGSTGWVNSKVPLYKNTGRLQISIELIKATVADPTSFVRGLQASTQDLKNSAARDYNRQLFGTSNGVIAQCGTTTTANLIVLTGATEVQMRQLRVGMVVDIGTVAAPHTIAQAVTITAVDAATPTITVDGSTISTTSSHFVFRTVAGGAIGGVGQAEVTGLQSIVDSTGALHNVDPATTPLWSSYEVAVGGSFTEAAVEKAVDAVDIASGEFPSLGVTSHGVRRAAAAVLQSNKRIVNTTDLKGGYSAIAIDTPQGTFKLTADRDCPNGTLFGLNMDHFNEYYSADWEFMDMDGAVLSRVPNYTMYEATLIKISEQATDQRNANFKLRTITEA
jgi:hypothetical protein